MFATKAAKQRKKNRENKAKIKKPQKKHAKKVIANTQ